MKIYKYLLNHGIIDEPQVVKMPYGARLLKVDNQRGTCVVWACAISPIRVLRCAYQEWKERVIRLT